VNFMKSATDGTAAAAYTRATTSHQRRFNALSLPSDEVDGQVESGRTFSRRSGCVCMLLSFQRPAPFVRRGIPSISNRS
jgi:hypothetical protein